MRLSIRTGNEKYPALTGIRAMGAIAVFFDHFPVREGSYLNINVMAFFYVLSGFLIIRIYYDQAQLTRPWLKKYFVNRFARIYPVYFLLLTIVVILNHNYRPWLLFKNYTLIHALFHNTKDFLIEPSWSLTVEECFYFFAPLIMILTRLYNFFVPLLLAIGMLLLALLISKAGIGFLETPTFVFSTTFFGHFWEFFAGVWLALLIMKRTRSQDGSPPLHGQGLPPHDKSLPVHGKNLPLHGQSPSHGKSLPPQEEKKKGFKWTAAGILGIIVLMIHMGMIYRHMPLDQAGIILINNFLIPFPIALCYFGLITEDNFLARILSGRIFGILGRSSYAFYLLHTIIIVYISRPILAHLSGAHLPDSHLPNSLISDSLIPGDRFMIVWATFIVTYLISIGLYLFYEEPLNLYIRKKFIHPPRS